MNIQEALDLILNGNQTSKPLNEVIRYSTKYLTKYTKNQLEQDEVISVATTKLYLRKETYNPDKASPITWYTKILFNEFLQAQRTKEKERALFDTNIYYETGKMNEAIFEDKYILDPMHSNSEEVRLYIEENEPVLYYYLYSIPFVKGYVEGRITYNDVMKKYDISMQTAKNRIRLAKQKTIEHFTGHSKYKEDRAKHCEYNRQHRLKKKQEQNETN